VPGSNQLPGRNLETIKKERGASNYPWRKGPRGGGRNQLGKIVAWGSRQKLGKSAGERFLILKDAFDQSLNCCHPFRKEWARWTARRIDPTSGMSMTGRAAPRDGLPGEFGFNTEGGSWQPPSQKWGEMNRSRKHRLRNERRIPMKESRGTPRQRNSPVFLWRQ